MGDMGGGGIGEVDRAGDRDRDRLKVVDSGKTGMAGIVENKRASCVGRKRRGVEGINVQVVLGRKRRGVEGAVGGMLSFKLSFGLVERVPLFVAVKNGCARHTSD